MEIIDSINDFRIQELIEALENPGANNLIVGEGIRVCSAFYGSEGLMKAKAFFMAEDFVDLNYKFLRNSDVFYVKRKIIDRISNLKTPPGIIGVYEINYDRNLPKDIDSTFVLYQLSDPGNVGTIIRTAVALNRKEIVFIDGCNPFLSKVIQSSAGMIAHIKVFRVTIEEFFEKMSKTIPLYALDINGEDINEISDSEMNICYIMVGNEAHGIPDSILEKTSRKLRLPMSPKCESLNAAISAAIVGYRSWRI